MYADDELLPISALQHLLFCERRAALVYVERRWGDNELTAEGAILHQRAHVPGSESRGHVRTARSLRIRSLELGLVGQTDVVEFHLVDSADSERGTVLDGAGGVWRPQPVEYKRGSWRKEHGYEVQLCAQAMCLEEMMGVPVPKGVIFYGASHCRLEIEMSSSLRDETRAATRRLREIVESAVTPGPEYGAKCNYCSLKDLCLPGISRSGAASSYVARMYEHSGDDSA